LKLVEQVFKQFNPQYPFNYRFVDEEYAKKFDDTQRTATLAALFAGLTIVISCLGLFGLAAYMAENRIKEIRCAQSAWRKCDGHHNAFIKRFFKTGDYIICNCIACCVVCHAPMAFELHISRKY
jgi:hypothetical protein